MEHHEHREGPPPLVVKHEVVLTVHLGELTPEVIASFKRSQALQTALLREVLRILAGADGAETKIAELTKALATSEHTLEAATKAAS